MFINDLTQTRSIALRARILSYPCFPSFVLFFIPLGRASRHQLLASAAVDPVGNQQQKESWRLDPQWKGELQLGCV